MEQERAFLESIRDDPDDALHRLAWADWLDDRGETRRADFIRAQVRLNALKHDDPARDALEDEADDLLAGHENEWAGRVGELALEWSWQGGCIERVTLWADTLLTHGEELFALAPIRDIRLLTETGDSTRLVGCSLLARVETLDLGRSSPDSFLTSAYQRDRPFQQLMISPHWTRLRRLRLGAHGIEGPLIQTLIDTGLFARLAELDLSNNHALGDRTARLLAAERSNTLQTLAVQGTNLSAFGVRQLMQAKSWPTLRRLEFNAAMLFSSGLTDESFEREWTKTLGAQLTTMRFAGFPIDGGTLGVLMNWEGLSRLEELSLVSCRVSAEGAARLADCANLSGLRSLDLSNNQFSDTGARALAMSPHLARLSTLRLPNADIGGPGIRAVASWLTDLKELDLSGNYVGGTGAEALVEGRIRSLRRLYLADANLNGESARLLAGAKALAGLRLLRLGHNSIGDEGVVALAQSTHLTRLRELYLDSCGMGTAGAKALAESPYLTRLARLGLSNTYITSREREWITVRFGPGAQF